MVFKPDYNRILRDVERQVDLNIETYGSKVDQSVSSGLLCVDLILGNGGWVPGLHTSLGFEQSAKTTLLIHFLHEALTADIPVIEAWDYEKTFASDYALNFHNNKSMTRETFGKMKGGKWEIPPRIPSYDSHVAEDFFDAVHSLCKRLPRKRKIEDTWFYIYKKTRENLALIDGQYDKGMFRALDKYCIEAADGLPQVVLGVDSYPNMLPENMDAEESSNAAAGPARMFSDQLKRVKALMASRNVIWLGVNQMRIRPMIGFKGNPEYEPCGQALQINSDVRLGHRAISIPPQYLVTGAKDRRHLIEKSITHAGRQDSYRFITITVVKNKVGGSPIDTRIHQRIWEYDGKGTARGLDPVFDTWQYLYLTSQVAGNLKKFTLDVEGNPLHGCTLTYPQFKTLIAGRPEGKKGVPGKKEVCAKLGINENPRIRQWCFDQLRSGVGYDYFHKYG